jgi:hypothetical protein
VFVPKAVGKNGKKLAGAAKTSFMQKCEKGGLALTSNPLGGTAALANGIGEIRRHRTQKLECFDQIGLDPMRSRR